MQRLVEKENYIPVISYTTCPPRPDEKADVDYFFKTEKGFKKLVQSGDIFEYRLYNTLVNNKQATWYYGSIKQDFDPKEDYVTVLDLKELKAYLDVYGSKNIRVTYITAPCEERMKHAMLRSGFDQTEWDRRAKENAKDFTPKRIEEIEKTYQIKISKIINMYE